MTEDSDLARALRHIEDGEWDEAAALLRDAAAEQDDDPTVLCWLGVVEHELGMDGVAYERFKRCLALNPEDPNILATAGTGVARFDDPDAEPALRTAALKAPDLAYARTMYGAYLAREGMLEEALRELNVAVELDPDDSEARTERGVALALSQNFGLAVDDFEQASRFGDSGWVRVLAGLALHELGRLDEAAVELSLGARERPEDVGAQLLAALATAGSGDPDTAWEMLERARMVLSGADTGLLDEVEERLDDSAEAAAYFLAETLVPAALHERLMARP